MQSKTQYSKVVKCKYYNVDIKRKWLWININTHWKTSKAGTCLYTHQIYIITFPKFHYIENIIMHNKFLNVQAGFKCLLINNTIFSNIQYSKVFECKHYRLCWIISLGLLMYRHHYITTLEILIKSVIYMIKMQYETYKSELICE